MPSRVIKLATSLPEQGHSQVFRIRRVGPRATDANLGVFFQCSDTKSFFLYSFRTQPQPGLAYPADRVSLELWATPLPAFPPSTPPLPVICPCRLRRRQRPTRRPMPRERFQQPRKLPFAAAAHQFCLIIHTYFCMRLIERYAMYSNLMRHRDRNDSRAGRESTSVVSCL